MSRRRSTTVPALALAAALALTACGAGAGEEETGSNASGTRSAETASASASGAHNDADIAFAQGMIPHHAQAVEMSDSVLSKDGVDQRVRTLAEQIKEAQAPEIEDMTRWLEEWDADVPPTDGPAGMDHSGMGHGDEGMMTQEDMHALADAHGADASTLFLRQMIAHHRGALKMAETELAGGRSPQAIDLAQNILDSQRAEITEMETLLEQL